MNNINATRTKMALLFFLAVAISLTIAICLPSLQELYRRWSTEEAYSHGPLLVLLALYIAYETRDRLIAPPSRHHWAGIVFICAATALHAIGELSALFIVSQYAFILILAGLAVSCFGIKSIRLLSPAFILLFFAIPLPYFLQANITAHLQLASSYIGVAIIKLFSIPAFLEGNVIDLGVIKLQVVEACAGLKYLFSLMSFGFICAYLYHAATWKRIVIFLSTIPITILMNSFRIAIGGILINKFGIGMADELNHSFQGFSVFALCLVILFIEMWLLTKVGGNLKSFSHTFGLGNPNKTPAQPITAIKFHLYPQLLSLIIIGAAGLYINQLERREEFIPTHKPLINFPLQLGRWQGSNIPINNNVVKKLKATDYIQANFHAGLATPPVTFYVAYYSSQRKGASPHSPKVCIPGGGWEITDISRQVMPFSIGPEPLKFNRVIISKGSNKQLVYYWFQQRGRYIANEYTMKWYLFKDSMLKNRSDGALVRLVTPIAPRESIEQADERLTQFTFDTTKPLAGYLPN